MTQASRRRALRATASLAALVMALPATAQEVIDQPHLNFYGVPGAIDTPTARAMDDGELSITGSRFAGITRSTLSFQLAPRISGSFRYTRSEKWNRYAPSAFDDYGDRSFDVRFKVLNEGRWRPDVTVGLQDFLGTGLLAGEYVVATKQITPRLEASAGLGWGRLASANDIGTPFGERPKPDVGKGGTVDPSTWFRGPVAPFASLTFDATDKLTLRAEYSSDAYSEEAGLRKLFDRKSDFNFGVDYEVAEGINLGVFSLYGSEVGAMVNVTMNPRRPSFGPSGAEPAPQDVTLRPSRVTQAEDWDHEWVNLPEATPTLRRAAANHLEAAGLRLESFAYTSTGVTLRFENPTYGNAAQAIGRAARALTASMPPTVETFRLQPVINGIAASEVVLKRSDIERLETAPQNDEAIRARAEIRDAVKPAQLTYAEDRFPKFNWSLGPYVNNTLFDPDTPLQILGGLQFAARYEPTPGLVLSGKVRKRLFGEVDEKDINPLGRTDLPLPEVRTQYARYKRDGDPGIPELTAAYYFRPGKDLYGRVTVGLLERMYGGVSTEVLWKPVDSRLAFGAEANYVKQRDFDMMFGFRDYEVLTGHVSAYADLGAGYEAQVDVGRYLAGDEGVTLSLNRTFDNGWEVGAFATKTNVSAEDFGEGSFDKGIRLTVPISWVIGRPTQRELSAEVHALTRDGGARLDVEGRLYDMVHDYHQGPLEGQWGRFWR